MKNRRMRWTAALKRLPKDKKIRVAEVGVWTGLFSEQLLIHRPLLRLYQIDRWKAYSPEEQEVEQEARMSRYNQIIFDKAKAENLYRIAKFSKRIKIIENDSVEAAKQISDKHFNLIFIDGAHSYIGCLADIKAWLPKVVTGGWIGGHDYPRRPGVKRAVEEIFGNKVKADSDNTWWVQVNG
jgi:hypothetical protein